MTEKLLNADDVAEVLGVTKDWVHRAARECRLPVVQLGRFQRFRREAIEQWIREQECVSRFLRPAVVEVLERREKLSPDLELDKALDILQRALAAESAMVAA